MNQVVLSAVFASLNIMWKGMLGLFIVCGGVAVLMMFIAKIVQKPKR
jgi:NADH:ubiquinone oxidoreductase subunit 6 (subunit J)